MKAAALTLLALLAVSPARADEESARRLVGEGEAAFAAGHFGDAVTAFEAAFRQSHRPKLLWNIAQSWRRQFAISNDLADLRRAVAVFTNFEDLAGNDAERAEARAAIAETKEEIRVAEEALPKPPPPPVVAPPAPPPPPPPLGVVMPPSPPPGPSPRELRAAARLRTAGVVLLVAGLGAIAAGATLSIFARIAFDEINQPRSGYVFDPDTQARLQLFQPLGIGLLAGGGALFVTGVVLVARGSSDAKRPHAALTLAPTGLVAAGAF